MSVDDELLQDLKADRIELVGLEMADQPERWCVVVRDSRTPLLHVSFRFTHTGEICEIQVRNIGDAQWVTARMLRSLRMATLERHARSFARQVGLLSALNEGAGAVVEPKQRRGGPKPIYSDLFYAQRAKRYLELLPHGNPIKLIAEEGDFTVSQVRNQIVAARAKGMLSRTIQGVPAGELTDKAKRLLSEASKAERA